MSQTEQQEQGVAPAKPGARRDWELFWRIIAGLMLLVIAWGVWVLYQITPRSVVTPLAYASQGRSVGTQQFAAGAAAPAVPTGAGLKPAAEVVAADPAMELAQEAARAGAHQASADVQARAFEEKQRQIQGNGLRLATEIVTPLTEKQAFPKTQEGKPDGAPAVPAATGTAGKDRP